MFKCRLYKPVFSNITGVINLTRNEIFIKEGNNVMKDSAEDDADSSGYTS